MFGKTTTPHTNPKNPSSSPRPLTMHNPPMTNRIIPHRTLLHPSILSKTLKRTTSTPQLPTTSPLRPIKLQRKRPAQQRQRFLNYLLAACESVIPFAKARYLSASD